MCVCVYDDATVSLMISESTSPPRPNLHGIKRRSVTERRRERGNEKKRNDISATLRNLELMMR